MLTEPPDWPELLHCPEALVAQVVQVVLEGTAASSPSQEQELARLTYLAV